MWLQSEQHLSAFIWRFWSINSEKARLSRGDEEVVGAESEIY